MEKEDEEVPHLRGFEKAAEMDAKLTRVEAAWPLFASYGTGEFSAMESWDARVEITARPGQSNLRWPEESGCYTGQTQQFPSRSRGMAGRT